MTAAFISLLPVFIVILIGWALRYSGLITQEHWDAVDHVCYFVLFPALIFKEIVAADFSRLPVAPMALAMIAAVLTMIALLLALRKPMSAALAIDGAQFTSVLQGAARWHTFIAFALITLSFGAGALALGAVAAAAMTPVLNIAIVTVMTAVIGGRRPGFRALLATLTRNPYVLASLGGIVWKALPLTAPALGLEVLDMIGRGALGLALLTVGAGLRVEAAMAAKAPVFVSTVLKLLVMPALMFGWLKVFGVTGEPAAVAMLCAAVPTGSGAYVLARRMGGDATLVANITTVQVICAAITIPLVMAMMGS